MRNTLIGGIVLLATMLLNAEGTTVSSYTGIIKDQMNKATDTTPATRVKESKQDIEKQKDIDNAEQAKWDKLTEAQQHAIQADRTAKRDEGLTLINKLVDGLDNDSRVIADKKSAMIEREKFDANQKTIDQKKTKLLDMKNRLENAPVGENVDLTDPMTFGEKVEKTFRRD